MAILREGRTLIPTGNDALRRGDELFTVVDRERLAVVLSLFGKADQRLDTLMILGGGRIGRTLAARLERQGVGIVLVDMDKATSLKAAGELTRTTVVHAEASAIDTLAAEGLLDKDAFVAVTGDDETNVLSCLLARRLGVRRTIALVNKESYLPLLSMIGVDASVNTRVAAADAILAFVRRREVRTLASLGDIDAEIVEFEIGTDGRLAGKKLASLAVPPGIARRLDPQGRAGDRPDRRERPRGGRPDHRLHAAARLPRRAAPVREVTVPRCASPTWPTPCHDCS